MLRTIDTAQTEMIPNLVKFSAMVFGALNADQTLQSMADALGVSTIAICRLDKVSLKWALVIQNSNGAPICPDHSICQFSTNSHHIVLQEDDANSDILVARSPMTELTGVQRDTLQQMTAFLSGAWRTRSTSFETSLMQLKLVPDCSIRHPSNPFSLTRTELRICDLIAQGHRPNTMAETLDISMATTRTHLRHVYAKTGLDGMLSVLHNLQAFDTAPSKEI